MVVWTNIGLITIADVVLNIERTLINCIERTSHHLAINEEQADRKCMLGARGNDFCPGWNIDGVQRPHTNKCTVSVADCQNNTSTGGPRLDSRGRGQFQPQGVATLTVNKSPPRMTETRHLIVVYISLNIGLAWSGTWVCRDMVFLARRRADPVLLQC